MKNLALNLAVGLGALGLCGGALMAMNPSDSGKGGKHAKQDELAPSIETLQKQLMRRFTERTNVDFGFSRVVRPNRRIHFGPTMEIPRNMTDLKREGGQTLALDSSGQWRKLDQYRDEMHPENDDEKNAIQAFLTAHRDVGIYTFGRFDGSNKPQRLKGPAVLNQFSGQAPTGASLQDFSTRAWLSGKDAYRETINGWDVYATRVAAADQACVNCHQQQGNDPNPSNLKAGDPIGMFVIAVRKPDGPVVHG